MPVRFLSDAQREQLLGFPAEFDDEALDRLFTLSGADLVEARRRRGDGNRLGWSLQLCGLRILGFCPDDVSSAPAVAVRFVARQLGVDPGVLAGYGERAQTRTDHVNQVKAYLGFRSPTVADLEEVRDWLGAEALVQDRPVVLFRLACERLHELCVVRPGLTVIEQSLVGAAREAARQEAAARVAGLCTPQRCRLLDGLLRVGPELGGGQGELVAPVRGPGLSEGHARGDGQTGVPAGAGEWDLGVLPVQRVTTLARRVQAASNQALAQSSPERRYPALLAFAARRVVEVTDELVDLFDKLLGEANAAGVHHRCTKAMDQGCTIPGMPQGPGLEPGREAEGGDSVARASLAGLSPSRLREWLPGVFAARLLRGVRLPSGRVVGETDRVVHLFPIPSGRVIPERLRAFCGLALRPGQAELVTVGTGMPCVACVVAAPNPEPT